ncbi:MAG: sigma-70 family RNA polymerase sigma factor [Myxococcales bacterium]|nr:sigma-70 family RNA polymerase sigma factor [Myxococcales bacterium]
MSSKHTRPDRAEEQELLARVLDGDKKAWTLFCSRYENLIVGCVLRVLRRYNASYTSADLADLVSEVWVVLLKDDRRKLRLYEPTRGYRVSSWIGLIATNCTIDQLRMRQAEHSYLDDISGADRFLVTSERPDARLEMEETADLARQALAQLTEDEQRFVVSCYRDERAPAELAEELGVTVNTVYSRKFKVRQKLVRIVENMGIGAAYAAAA